MTIIREVPGVGWLVEEALQEGGVAQAMFSGPHARDRAYAYLLWQTPDKGRA